MHLVLLLILAGALFLAAELWLVACIRVRSWCFVPPAVALIAFLWTLWKSSTAMGWDSLGWAFWSAMALSALAGTLAGGAAGLVLRRIGRKKERQDTEN